MEMAKTAQTVYSVVDQVVRQVAEGDREASARPEAATARVTAMLEETVQKYVRTATQIADNAKELAWEMSRVAEAAEAAARFEPASLNSLGVVQMRGQQLDLLCAQLQTWSEAYRVACYAAGVDSTGLAMQLQAELKPREA
jgi:hypothetical protein